jgi:CheY-like chemotaxis protein
MDLGGVMDFYKWGEDYQNLLIKKIHAFAGTSFGTRSDFAHSEIANSEIANSEIANSEIANSELANIIETKAVAYETPEYASYLKSYLKKYTFDFNKIGSAKRILIIEEDSRVQNILQRLIQEENTQAVCVFGETLDDVLTQEKLEPFDLVIASYYESEDEVDYEFWDQARIMNPQLQVIVLSHLNDRDYYDVIYRMIDRFDKSERAHHYLAMKSKLKNFFGNVFGGRHGQQ